MDEQTNASEATRNLFDLYGNQVYQYVRFTLGNATEAEDVVQDIFLNVLRSWNQFENRSSAKTWLWSITRNCMRDALRQKNRHQRQPIDSIENLRDVSSSNSFHLLELEDSLHHLSLSHRKVVILRIIQDRTGAETAQLLGWSEVKVRVTLHRALKKLQEVFLDTNMR
ncbi:MAG: hypothetical protein JWN30_1262 [Bacilli bacterium]|nr:hypothetical protein [Bacilli bacterium]